VEQNKSTNLVDFDMGAPFIDQNTTYDFSVPNFRGKFSQTRNKLE
jgi:hypothetical protein